MFVPKERLMMKYAPPPATRRLVAISETARTVGIVTRCPISMIMRLPKSPTWATA